MNSRARIGDEASFPGGGILQAIRPAARLSAERTGQNIFVTSPRPRCLIAEGTNPDGGGES